MNEVESESAPNYAFLVQACDEKEINRILRMKSCNVCGHPFFRAGDPCPFRAWRKLLARAPLWP
ncbi:MAG: hypothetical protein A3H57_04470 [Candidatus Taylorbacteria bacterium RIFCSPLOWO2_02_FULL_43_11]|uniref:Uncharacterized protein n=1 Tax=Candidatus Taylorbacteria bacterium RIFCSPHIGHO2_02_FULL_43_32b TaxID=1802306 RepID=A0A1G2MEW8_9BACT|nr:MAG: hypothetical protein A2743_02205 [Candidatus Taylorbacteria bacterium RIFCSPHIGHO2_01_FULL_43_47]OHA22450.1 MAG: hypothetical protein A3C72_03420 [Candidatus Taylorbacteria bacterium RIFCSPHIGHO2_02_FULL_43_32b]OHA31638.1 MAG: hypothetical protein A3B08_04125 [Candidatus Taylorbacteria bacterium RIFCSPLOWO2_01_FULL_43_44]OHA36218.1 MAG: hypothetical protein A3H57_04470 [Candidatus Taylorbacteria bacterium RIFCSPLOWO2_02_FULL_43_11]